VIRWQETTVEVKKKKLYLCLLAWMPCCFQCSMDVAGSRRDVIWRRRRLYIVPHDEVWCVGKGFWI
jgi:hypothetical protein